MCIMKFNWNKRTLASSRELWLSFWCEVQYNSLYSIQEFLRLVAPRKHLLLLNPWSFQWEKVQYVVVEWEMVLDSYNPVPGVMEGVPSSRDYNGGFASKLMIPLIGAEFWDLEIGVHGNGNPLGSLICILQLLG